MSKVIIADMDGTLAKIPEGANPYKRDFRKDGRNYPVIHAFGTLIEHTGYTGMIFTGRMNSYYPEFSATALEMTEQWLSGVGLLDMVDGVYIRADGDSRKDSIIKREMLETVVGSPSRVHCIFDDRPQVVRMWRELGIFVFDCHQGTEEF